MTSIELTIVILTLISLTSILFVSSRAWKRGADRAACIANIHNVQLVTRSYQNLQDLEIGAPLDVAAMLVGPENFLPSLADCPAGGTYSYAESIPPVGFPVVNCTLGGSESHVPVRTAG
jgi:hypothetical protein